METYKEKLIRVPNYKDSRGDICVIEFEKLYGFIPRRSYYISNVPLNKNRADHGHLELQQVFLPISGRFVIDISDKSGTRTYKLNSNSETLYVPKKKWRKLYNFSENCICLVYASLEYDLSDYYYDKEDFIKEL